MSSSTKPTIVIVDGAWTDASSFTGVQKILSADGFDVVEFGEHSSDRPLFSAPVAAGSIEGMSRGLLLPGGPRALLSTAARGA
jgi:hypothetical protein